MTLVNQEPGPRTVQSAARIAAAASGAAGGSGGLSRTDSTRPGVTASSCWPRMTPVAPGSAGSAPAHQRLDLQRHRRHRQDPAARAEQPADPVQGADRVAEPLPQRGDEQVADRVAVQAALGRAAEAVLQHVGPGAAPLVVAAQRGQRHPQVAGRQAAEFAADAAGGAAVVGDGDDRGQGVGDGAQRGQGRGQAVAAAEGHDPRRRDGRRRPCCRP